MSGKNESGMKSQNMDASPLQLSVNRLEHWDAFVRLNTAWITRYFSLEPPDHVLFEGRDAFLEKGGVFLSLQAGEEVVGVCTLVPEHPGVFELGKMAVDERYQGRGLSHLLMQGALDEARQRGGQKVVLYTNSTLAAAIALYRKHGFRETHIGPHPSYTRVDLIMEKSLLPDSSVVSEGPH